MAQNTTISVPAATWTQLTDADVTAITFQNVAQDVVLIRTTNGATAPTDTAGAIIYYPGQGERAVALSDLTPGVASANRVWAYCNSDARVAVSHA